VDAFFSPPARGVEIGGILLGSIGKDRLTIVDSMPLRMRAHGLVPYV
jgi:hypothetical protein